MNKKIIIIVHKNTHIDLYKPDIQ